MKKTGWRVSVALLSIFSAAQTAFPYPKAQTPSSVRDLNVSDVSIPAELGYIVETHELASSKNSPLLIHIQEAHVNYEAQKHLAEILQHLVKRYRLKLILVEGGDGEVGLSYLRSYGPPDNRRQVAEKYLKLGLINGAEYLDIVSDDPLIIWGVEEGSLYRKNLKAYKDIESLQESLKPTLAAVDETIATLKSRLFGPDLQEFETKSTAFEEERLGVSEYAEYLSEAAAHSKLALDQYPNLKRLLQLYTLERAIDREAVTREQQSLITRLKFHGSGQDSLNRLLADAKKPNVVGPEEFYKRLAELATAAGLSLDQYPSLASYVTYVNQRAGIVTTALSDELERLRALIEAQLSVTPRARQVLALAEQVDLVKKLAQLKLNSNEYERFETLELKGISSEWQKTLQILLAEAKLSSRSFDGLGALESALPRLQRFYEAANARNSAMVSRALEKLKETNEPIAVLITGGFHSPKITQLLKDQAVQVVVVAPKVERENNEQLYRAAFRFKNGQGSFEDVQKAASADRAMSTVGSH